MTTLEDIADQYQKECDAELRRESVVFGPQREQLMRALTHAYELGRDDSKAEVAKLRSVLACIHDLATYDDEERDMPDEDEMVDTLCEIHELSRPSAAQPVRSTWIKP